MDNITWDNTRAVLEEYAMTVRNLYQDKLIINDHIATGNLINNLNYTVNVNGSRIEVSLELEDYWKYVEYDTKPHFPPVDALVNWIKAKPVLPHKTFDGKLPDTKQLAYLIGRKISEEGTTGTHSLEDTIDEVNTIYELKIEEAIMKDLTSDINAILIMGFNG